MSTVHPHIAVVGGGISGLATAYYLGKQTSARVTIIEKEPRLGGKIVTHRAGPFIFEGGPESFVTRKPEAWELCHELGLADRLVGTAARGKNYVLHHGRPQLVPMNPLALIQTPLLSARGKLRLLQEPFIARRQESGDESLGGFLRRRIGDEAVDQLAKPAIGSIYLGDIDAMSVQVSFGAFAELERAYGSLVRGMLAQMREKRAARRAAGQQRVKRPPFATLRGGLGELIDELAAALHGNILTRTAVTGLQFDHLSKQPFALTLSNGQVLFADAVVLAVPTFIMATLVGGLDRAAAAPLQAIDYHPVTTINLAFNRGEVAEPFDGFGVVVPESETARLLAVEGMSVKFPHRAPNDQLVLRAFVGGSRRPELASLPDDELIQLVRRELTSIFNISAEPTAVHITRWLPANPQPAVGHLAMIEKVEARLADKAPGLYLTGAGLRGQGIPDCIRQARTLAGRIASENSAFMPAEAGIQVSHG